MTRPQSQVGQAKTRRFVLAAGASASLAALAACGSPGSGAGGTTAKPITGSFLFWPEGGQTSASYQAWVTRLADFQRAYPEAKVEMVDIGGTAPERDAKLFTAVSAGTPPDVAAHDRYTVFGAAQRGVMKDLTSYAKAAGVKNEDQQPWCLEEVLRDGKLWGLPYSTDTRMVYVNAAHLKKAGLPLTAPKTLDDFDKVARQLTLGKPGSFERLGIAHYAPWNNWRLFGWGWLHGGEWYDAKANRVTMDHPKNIAALEWEVARTSELGGYQAIETFKNAQPKNARLDMFKAGTLSMVIESTTPLIGMFAEKDLDWIVWAPPPAAGVSRTHTWSGGFANVLPTGVKNPDGAFVLAKYVTDEDFQKIQNKTGSGRLPTNKNAAKDTHWNTVDPRIKQFVEMLPNSHVRPPIPQVAYMVTELDAAELAAIQGGRQARVALQEANTRVNDAIKEGRVS